MLRGQLPLRLGTIRRLFLVHPGQIMGGAVFKEAGTIMRVTGAFEIFAGRDPVPFAELIAGADNTDVPSDAAPRARPATATGADTSAIGAAGCVAGAAAVESG